MYNQINNYNNKLSSVEENDAQPSYEGNILETDIFVVKQAEDSKVLAVDEEHCYARRPISYNISRNGAEYNLCCILVWLILF